jgi:hypothetical protein
MVTPLLIILEYTNINEDGCGLNEKSISILTTIGFPKLHNISLRIKPNI